MPPHQMKPAEDVQASDYDVSWRRSLDHVQLRRDLWADPGHTEGIVSLLVWKHCSILPEEVEVVARVK